MFITTPVTEDASFVGTPRIFCIDLALFLPGYPGGFSRMAYSTNLGLGLSRSVVR